MTLANAMPTVHGWLALDKPLGLTSTQALGRARRLVGGKKVGHGGTLDPLATGILPLAFGEATKLIPYVMDGDKEYVFTVQWGERRSTGDAEGAVVDKSDVRPSQTSIESTLNAFVGLIRQKPPAYSAIKIDGERAYDIARAGGTPDIAAREVLIHGLKLTSQRDHDHAEFHVCSGKGMYVRALAEDLAAKLGTCGFVKELRRTRVGPFGPNNSISLEKLEELGHKDAALTALLALRTALDDIPALMLTASEAQRLRAGQGILIRAHLDHLIDAKLIFAEFQNVPVALVEPKAGELRVVRGFHF